MGELSNYATFNAYRLASATARTLPAPAAAGAARLMGVPLAGAMRSRRAMIGRHLQRVHGGALGPLALRRAIQQAFDSYARYWVESFRLPDMTPAQIQAGIRAEGVEHISAAIDAGNGAIVCMPHLGGWDFGGAYLATLGFRITVVVEKLEPPELFEWFAAFRRSLGIDVVALGPSSGTAILAALKRNEVVGLVADRDLSGTGAEVDFFGERTTLPAGPATLALRTGAPIIPAAIYFNDDPGHFGLVRPPLPIERVGRLRDDVTRLTQLLADELAYLIRRAPEQWHVFQPNWPSDREWLERRVLRP